MNVVCVGVCVHVGFVCVNEYLDSKSVITGCMDAAGVSWLRKQVLQTSLELDGRSGGDEAA